MPGGRPNSPRPGYWLYLGEHPIVHLATPRASEAPSPCKNYLDHIAFTCTGLPETLARLKKERVTYDLSVVSGEYAQVQVIVSDPAGTVIELNFKEPLPESERNHKGSVRTQMAV
jgi:hypothetical protein